MQVVGIFRPIYKYNNRTEFVQNQGFTPLMRQRPLYDTFSFGKRTEVDFANYKNRDSRVTVKVPQQGLTEERYNDLDFGEDVRLEGGPLNCKNRSITAGDKFTAETNINCSSANLNNNANVKNLEAEGLIDAKNAYHGTEVKAKNVVLGDDAQVTSINAAESLTIKGKGLRAKTVKAGKTMNLGKDAKITEEIIADGALIAGDGLDTKLISSKGNVTLGKVKNINELKLLTPTKSSRTLTFKSPDILTGSTTQIGEQLSPLIKQPKHRRLKICIHEDNTGKLQIHVPNVEFLHNLNFYIIRSKDNRPKKLALADAKKYFKIISDKVKQLGEITAEEIQTLKNTGLFTAENIAKLIKDKRLSREHFLSLAGKKGGIKLDTAARVMELLQHK